MDEKVDNNCESLELKVDDILFSQDSISSKFRGGKMHNVPLEETINLMSRLRNEDVDGLYT